MLCSPPPTDAGRRSTSISRGSTLDARERGLLSSEASVSAGVGGARSPSVSVADSLSPSASTGKEGTGDSARDGAPLVRGLGIALEATLETALDGGVSRSGRKAKVGRTRCGVGRAGRRCARCERCCEGARGVGACCVGCILGRDDADGEGG